MNCSECIVYCNGHCVENVVASAATNGVIITWDLNKPGRNKQGLYVVFINVFIILLFRSAVIIVITVVKLLL